MWEKLHGWTTSQCLVFEVSENSRKVLAQADLKWVKLQIRICEKTRNMKQPSEPVESVSADVKSGAGNLAVRSSAASFDA